MRQGLAAGLQSTIFPVEKRLRKRNQETRKDYQLIENAIGTENDYAKTTYRYLNNLYARWNKKEKALEYRDKYLGVKQGIS